MLIIEASFDKEENEYKISFYFKDKQDMIDFITQLHDKNV